MWLNAKRACLVIAQRQHTNSPAEQYKRQETDENDGRRCDHVVRLNASKTAEKPEGYRGQLVVGVGKHLDERYRCARQRADDNAGKNKDEDVAASSGRAPRRE